MYYLGEPGPYDGVLYKRNNQPKMNIVPLVHKYLFNDEHGYFKFLIDIA